MSQLTIAQAKRNKLKYGLYIIAGGSFAVYMAIFFYGLSVENSKASEPFRQRNIAEVKESSQIDSLLDANLITEPTTNCILFIEAEGKDEKYKLDLILIKTDPKQINLYDRFGVPDLAFFNYKGYVVFVNATEDQYHFFSSKQKWKVFNFQLTAVKSEKEVGDYMDNFQLIRVFRYEKGKFVSRIRKKY